MHLVLIALHATAGTLALGLGVVAMRRPQVFTAYAVTLVVSMLSLLAAVAWSWPTLAAPTRGVFSGLGVLAVVVLAQAGRAARAEVGSSGYVAGVGFTVVALADGFLVVGVLDLGAPAWAVVATGVGVAVAGHGWVGKRLGRVAGDRGLKLDTPA